MVVIVVIITVTVITVILKLVTLAITVIFVLAAPGRRRGGTPSAPARCLAQSRDPLQNTGQNVVLFVEWMMEKEDLTDFDLMVYHPV